MSNPSNIKEASQARKSYTATIIRSSSIGDVILASAVLDATRLLPFEVKITWLTKGYLVPLLKQNFPKHDFFDIEALDSSKIKQIKNTDPLFVLDLQTNPRSKILGQKLKGESTNVYSLKKNRLHRQMIFLKTRFHKRENKNLFYGRDHPLMLKKNISRFLLALESSLNNAEDLQSLRELSQKIRAQARPTFSRQSNDANAKHIITVAPGASFQPKQAPAKIFAESLNQFFSQLAPADQERIEIVFLGDKNDLAAIGSVQQGLIPKIKTQTLAGSIALEANQQWLERSIFFVGNDSGLTHFAEACATPTISFYGPTHPALGFSTSLPDSQIFSHAISCSPCSKHGAKKCRFQDSLCFNKISTDQVGAYMSDLFGRHTR